MVVPSNVCFLYWFLSDCQPRKAYAHQAIRRHAEMPDSLLDMDGDEFCRPRKVDRIDLFYRYHPSFKCVWLHISNLIVSRRTRQETNYSLRSWSEPPIVGRCSQDPTNEGYFEGRIKRWPLHQSTWLSTIVYRLELYPSVYYRLAMLYLNFQRKMHMPAAAPGTGCRKISIASGIVSSYLLSWSCTWYRQAPGLGQKKEIAFN